MLAVVRKPRTKKLFEVRGDIPEKIMRYLKREYGQSVEIVEDDEELVNIFETDWYKKISEETTPGDVMKIYRENKGWSQTELGLKLGKSRQRISDMETGKRGISKETAKKLSKLFGIGVERFI